MLSQVVWPRSFPAVTKQTRADHETVVFLALDLPPESPQAVALASVAELQVAPRTLQDVLRHDVVALVAREDTALRGPVGVLAGVVPGDASAALLDDLLLSSLWLLVESRVAGCVLCGLA